MSTEMMVQGSYYFLTLGSLGLLVFKLISNRKKNRSQSLGKEDSL